MIHVSNGTHAWTQNNLHMIGEIQLKYKRLVLKVNAYIKLKTILYILYININIL